MKVNKTFNETIKSESSDETRMTLKGYADSKVAYNDTI